MARKKNNSTTVTTVEIEKVSANPLPYCNCENVGVISAQCPIRKYLIKGCPLIKEVTKDMIRCCPEKECEIRKWRENGLYNNSIR